MVALFLGGVAAVPRQEGPYRRTVDRSYAAMAAVIIQRSNATGAALRSLVAALEGSPPSRAHVLVTLASLVQETGDQEVQGARLMPPDPVGGYGQDLDKVLTLRATATARIALSLDALIASTPTSAVRAAAAGPPPPGRKAQPAPPVTVRGAPGTLQAAGALLEQADTLYATLRQGLERAAGNASLPPSVWLASPRAWSSAAIVSLTSAIGASPSLRPRPSVDLAAFSVDPPPVPAITSSSTRAGGGGAGASGAGSPAVVPPTHSLAVTAVVVNAGNTAARSVEVTAEVRPSAGGPAVRARRSVDLAIGASSTVVFPALSVAPGRSYLVTVSLASSSPAASGGGAAGTTRTLALTVAPGTPSPSTPAAGGAGARTAGSG